MQHANEVQWTQITFITRKYDSKQGRKKTEYMKLELEKALKWGKIQLLRICTVQNLILNTL
jgi:hypothetical protein